MKPAHLMSEAERLAIKDDVKRTLDQVIDAAYDGSCCMPGSQGFSWGKASHLLIERLGFVPEQAGDVVMRIVYTLCGQPERRLDGDTYEAVCSALTEARAKNRTSLMMMEDIVRRYGEQTFDVDKITEEFVRDIEFVTTPKEQPKTVVARLWKDWRG